MSQLLSMAVLPLLNVPALQKGFSQNYWWTTHDKSDNYVKKYDGIWYVYDLYMYILSSHTLDIPMVAMVSLKNIFEWPSKLSCASLKSQVRGAMKGRGLFEPLATAPGGTGSRHGHVMPPGFFWQQKTTQLLSNRMLSTVKCGIKTNPNIHDVGLLVAMKNTQGIVNTKKKCSIAHVSLLDVICIHFLLVVTILEEKTRGFSGLRYSLKILKAIACYSYTITITVSKAQEEKGCTNFHGSPRPTTFWIISLHFTIGSPSPYLYTGCFYFPFKTCWSIWTFQVIWVEHL